MCHHSAQALRLLEQALAAAGSSKQLLLSVRVALKNVENGGAEWSSLWNDWVDGDALPALDVQVHKGVGDAGPAK